MSALHPLKRLLLRLLPALLPVAAAAVTTDWTNRVEVADRHALATLTCAWTRDGLRLQLASTNHAVLEFRLAPGRKPDVRLSPERLFPPNFEDAVQVWPAPAAAANVNVVGVTLRRQSHAWMLYVAEQPVARFPEPWPAGAVTIRHPAAALPAAGARDQYVQRTAPFRFEDSFMVAKTTTNQFPETWERACGTWSLHSVTGGLSGSVAQRGLARHPTPERSPNFYSLEGRGRHSVALAGEPFYHRYTFRAAVQHNGGTNGLVFLVTDSGACLGYTAFTDPETERLVFQLWRGNIAPDAPRQVLGTVATDLLSGQWTLMEVRVHDDRVACLADNLEILRLRLPLPAGGRFGLLAETDQSTRFDDVAVASHEEYPFESVADLRFHSLRQDGTFRNGGGDALAPAGGDEAAVALESPGDRAPREWLFGATDDTAHKLEICLQPRGAEAYAAALLAGWQGAGTPYYQFTCRQQDGRRSVALEQVLADGRRVRLDGADLGPAADGPVRLTLDALRPGELRGLVNGRLVAIDRPDAPVTGAGGLRLEGRTRIRLALPQYVSTAPVYADRFEKNPAYVNDPFMRHWAAPEGQWITMRDGLTWLRGDILGRVKIRLPVVTPSVLHLAIPEGETDGQCTVALRDSRLCVFTPASRTNAAISVAVTNIPEEKIETAGTLRLYTVNLEDDLLWLSTDSAILGRTHLPPLARGRRARIEGFTTELLHQTLVRRENVFDTLFNESLFNWTINGGVWEVINRFQCEPTWSHMNGESTNSFAGLWSKFVMSGDFCVEFYAGMRMGWYERPGDFDLTVHSRRNATCDGYSITTAGWDPDHSQIYTRLFRNGELEAVSTAYTAPRVRDGSVRAGYEPLIAAGRPVHGAWYGMRFRRVGDQLSYVFDNEPILSWRDPAPLDAGTFGIWTYRNSMMVARVRIAAESVRPRPFRHWVVAAPPPAPPPEIAAAVPGVRVNGRPAELLDPAVWQDADEVSRPLVRFGSGRGKRPVLCVTALEGGGTFLVAPHLAPIPAGRLLGWHFEIARHPEARVNFEFTAGRLGEHELTLTPESSTRYSFVLSGSDDARGDRRIAGSLPQPPAPSRVADLAPDTADRALVWTPVDVWLPAEAARKGLMVHVDGFGNLQPGDIQQGLGGNPPGAWYAVRNFHEIYSGVPELEGPAAVRAEIDALTRKAADLPSGCLNELRLPAALDAREPVIAWAVRPDAAFNLAARLDAATPEALRVASTLPWPSPLLPARGARLDGQPAPGWQEGNDYLVLLPRDAAAAPPAATTLTLELADGRTFKQLVPLASAATSQPPVLLACEMPEGGIQTFESRTVDPQQYQVRAGFALCCTDAVQGACIRFQNAGVPESRLDGRLLMNYDPVATPLLQFRYRADPMAHVTLNAGRCTMLFSERTGTPAAPGATGILDQAWHTWLGSPLTTAGGGPLRGGFAVSPGELRIGSRGSPDQTGHYSAISLDDIACGPAVGPRHPLAFRLSYTSRHGLAEVQYALGTGTPPWSERSAAERDALKWCAATNLEVIAPDTAALPEGTHHLFTRARSTRGAWSAVYDIPFVLDRQPPQIAFQVRAVPDRYNGTCLDVSIQGGYAPPLTRNLRLLFDGKPLNLQADNGTFSCGAASMQLEIDWPWLLRKSLARYKDGDTLTLTLDGVADAAGNESAAVQIPIRLVFADDKQPPAVLPVQNPTNLLVHAAQFHALQDFFSTYQGVTMQEAQQENGCSFVPFRLSGTESAYLMRQFSEKMWDPEAFPWLAFSVRIDGEFAAGTSPFEVRLRPGATLSDQAVKPKNGTSYVWKAPTADNQPFTLGHMDWKPGQWVDFLVNVRDLLRDETKMNKACTLRDVALYFPAKAKYTLQVRGLSILAPWSAPDVLRFRAYDLNGANGLTWQGGGASARLGLRPARLTLPADDNRWLKVRVADRPGNLSKVFLYPMPPNAAPVPESFPAEVEVEDF